MKITIPGREPAFAYTANHDLSGDAPVIVFIHGAQNDHCVWALQSRYFAYHGYRVMALDLPGHGASAGDALRDIGTLADWIAAVLQATGIDSATLVGHSMGSLIALECAARHPARVERIVLVGNAVPMAVSDLLLDAATTDVNRAIDMIANWSHSGLGHWPGPGFSMFMMAKRLMQRQPAQSLFTDLKACNDYHHGLDAAAVLHSPALLVSGAADQMTPARAARSIHAALSERALTLGLPAPRHVTLAGCGHNIMAEKPDELVALLREFLAAPMATASPA